MSSNGRENLLIVDFCNIKFFDHKTILDLQKKHKIFYNEQGRKNGFETCCISKRDSKRRHFALIENQNVIEFKTELEKELPEWQKPFVVLPTDAINRDLFFHLKASQNEFEKFILGFPKGLYGVEYINKLVNDLMRFFGLRFKMTQQSSLPQFLYEASYLSTFEDYIYWEIVSLFLQLKSNEIFRSIKKCGRCMKFYQAVNKKRTKKYCPECQRKPDHRTNMTTKQRSTSAQHHVRKLRKAMEEDKKLLRESEINVFMHKLEISRQEAIELWEDDQTI